MATIHPSMGMCVFVDRQTVIEIPGSTLGEALIGLKNRYPQVESMIFDYRGELQRFLNVYIDGQDARLLDGLDTPVTPDSEIVILPAGGGG
jgi:molybdopterin synthase sulfur carrier subunit